MKGISKGRFYNYQMTTRGSGGGRLDGVVLVFWVTTQKPTKKPSGSKN
jgi:hypothetical protein